MDPGRSALCTVPGQWEELLGGRAVKGGTKGEKVRGRVGSEESRPARAIPDGRKEKGEERERSAEEGDKRDK